MKHFLKFVWGTSIALLLTGCIDDNYDLSDIDTTSKFKVDSLAIPVNLAPVVLDDIIKIKEGDNLKKDTLNGKVFYAVKQTGEFHSDGINVNKFSVEPDPLQSKTATFRPAENANNARGYRRANGKSYVLKDAVNEEIHYTATDIDGAVRGLTEINFEPMLFEMTLVSSQVSKGIKTQMSDILLTLPKGLVIQGIKAGDKNGDKSYAPSVYNPELGTLKIESFEFTDEGKIQITATGLHLKAEYYGEDIFNYDIRANSGSMNLASEFNLDEATLNLEISSFPDEIEYEVNYKIGTLSVTSLLGSIYYDLSGTGLNIEPINLSNMPSILTDPQTNLILSNPQIYLQLINPIGVYGLQYQSSLEILAIRDNQEDPDPFPSPLVTVPATTGEYNVVLAPYTDKISNVPEKFAPGLDRLTYDRLGEILAGQGIPQMLDLKLIDPQIPVQTLTSPFKLGESISGMEGSYMFLAPLSLAKGSTIVKKVDGWWSEDLADLNIEKLRITANATNGTSMGVSLYVKAIDRDGNAISSEGTIALREGADNAEIELTLKGLNGAPFNNLDGVEIYVMADESDGQPLAPEQKITLENLKARVWGYYERKL